MRTQPSVIFGAVLILPLVAGCDEPAPTVNFPPAAAPANAQPVPQQSGVFDPYHLGTYESAQKGHPNAQFLIGFWYTIGQGGVQIDDVEALKWYRRAADQGLAKAQFTVGQMYSSGEGATKDEVEALKWYRSAADQGHAQAQFTLGTMYSSGEGATKDEVEALKWYRSAAEQEHAQAQLNLGLMYSKGQGTPEDAVEAYAWLCLAAAQLEDAVSHRDQTKETLTPEQLEQGQLRETELLEQVDNREL
ncbi:MAG: sel1 repeat family protein [Fuerstiella sp.]|nr:sel1 repeat family protein [Fuerstiella sp.]